MILHPKKLRDVSQARARRRAMQFDIKYFREISEYDSWFHLIFMRPYAIGICIYSCDSSGVDFLYLTSINDRSVTLIRVTCHFRDKSPHTISYARMMFSLGLKLWYGELAVIWPTLLLYVILNANASCLF